MAFSPPRHLALPAVVCGIGGVLGWAFYLAAFSREPSQDWMVYYTAARAYWDGDLPLLYDGVRLTAVINQHFAAWLSWPLPLHPWLYPPHFLLLLLPFGLFPPAASCAAFLLIGFALVVAATWCFADDRAQRRLHAVSLLLCPAAAITVCLGQNAFLTAALLVGGFGLIERRPLLAGALFGMLTYKPQLFILVPVALVAARHWKVLASLAVAAAIAALASAAVLGPEPWREWLGLMLRPSALYRSWAEIGRINGQSVYACAVLLGAAPGLANLIQGIGSVLAAGTVYWVFRRPVARDLRMTVLLAATMLAAPHIIGYDALLLAIAATLLLCRAAQDGWRAGEAIVIVLAWLSPLANPPSVFRLGLLTPVLIVLLIACALVRARAALAAPGAVPSLDASELPAR